MLENLEVIKNINVTNNFEEDITNIFILNKKKKIWILSSIKYHTTLRKNPTKYDMVLFIADKLAWDQEGEPPYYDIVMNELNKSLYHASFAYIKYIIDNNMILLPHKWIKEAFSYLKNYINNLII